ncbi:MAG: hypothetical protein CMA63_08265 [Euryarchaeota archaeon]|nr:hypothetical protein [Euryarchaeota archaeon]
MAITWASKPWSFWKTHWQNRTDFKHRRISLMIIGFFVVGAAIPYLIINRIADYFGRRAFNPEIPFDVDLPFMAWMVIPYLSLYLYYPAAAWLGNKNDVMWRQNIVFHQMMITSNWMCFAVFLIFPVEIDLRHLVVGIEGSGWEAWYVLVHGVDKPWNSWPSLHVVQSTQIVMILRYWYPSTTRKVWVLQTLLVICCALLVISTLTIKQHYLWDAITGLTFTAVTWKFWMKPCLDRLKEAGAQKEFDTLMNA